ncbi:MAG: AI-2E family transporter [Bacillota bacterium]|nr:AI-2E family transporter [Bacillota bacterium]MDP4171747.1 AI-2E family transporter [Bacillota bacterium]
MWINKPFFKYAAGILISLMIIYMLGKIDYFVWPFQKLIATIFFPILISGLLYHLLRPVVRLFAKGMNKNASIVLVFLLFFGSGYLLFHFAAGPIASQIGNLSNQFPDKVEKISKESKKAVGGNSFGQTSIDTIEKKAHTFSTSFYNLVENNVSNIISIITSIASVLAVVPFIVFYFLRDDEKLRPHLLKFLPEDRVMEGNRILLDIDKTLSTYIVGQMIIAVTDGILLYIGFLIIGLKNGLLLAIFAMFMTVIPFVGPVIGMIPAVLVALLQSPFMVFKVIIVTLIATQIDGNLVTPRVMGKRLDLHPLSVIFLLLIAGALYGFTGAIIAIPLYSVIKVTIKNVIKFYKLRNPVSI